MRGMILLGLRIEMERNMRWGKAGWDGKLFGHRFFGVRSLSELSDYTVKVSTNGWR